MTKNEFQMQLVKERVLERVRARSHLHFSIMCHLEEDQKRGMKGKGKWGKRDGCIERGVEAERKGGARGPFYSKNRVKMHGIVNNMAHAMPRNCNLDFDRFSFM